MMNWGETFQSWRNEIPSVRQIFSLEPIYQLEMASRRARKAKLGLLTVDLWLN